MKNLLLSLATMFAIVSQAQDLKYQLPPAEIMALADYERAPAVRMNYQKTHAIYLYRNTYKTLSELSQPELRLGGLRINPNIRIASDITYMSNVRLRDMKSKDVADIAGLPKSLLMANGNFSPNGLQYAFTNSNEQGVALFIIDVLTKQCKQITPYNLNAVAGSPYMWMDNNEMCMIKQLPQNANTILDAKSEMPKGPTVGTSEGKASQNRTYADLLKTPLDEVNFETLMQSEINKVDMKGNITKLVASDMATSMSIAPNGQYFLLTTIKRPFSYVVPFSRFPNTTTLYTMDGKKIKVLNDVPLTEIMPKGFSSVRQGKRNMAWRPDMPASLYYAEALDEGDQSKKMNLRDAIYTWDAPFEQPATLIAKTENRFSNIIFWKNKLALIEDNWYDTRKTKLYKIDLANSSAAPIVIWDRNYQDIYSDPGNFELERNANNRYELAVLNNKAFLIGDGFAENGQFPFISELDLKTFETKKIYTSNKSGIKEDIIEVLDYKTKTALVMQQSAVDFPNYYILNFGKKPIWNQLTDFKNPFLSLSNVTKEVIKYTRNDGLPLSGTLYLPAGYDKNKKEKLPLLIWAYPEEYKDRKSAGQSNKNPNEFTYPNYGSFVYWVTKGYAVLDDASFPIIGEDSTEPNDNFMPQLINNAKAAIDAVDALGYIDPKRCAIGGHSYGAFMTANLLTHSKLFACGIARSGAYNRTLTPFGFQSEQRNYWDVPALYNEMSPFMNANKMKTPLLLVHGDADNNPGTFTLQTERYFQALKGLGAPVRMVLLPRESHGYAARENILHLLWEQDQFLEKYLK